MGRGPGPKTYIVDIDDTIPQGLVQHPPVPVLQSLWLGDLLLDRMTVEDVVVPFARWTSPDVGKLVPGETRGGKGNGIIA